MASYLGRVRVGCPSTLSQDYARPAEVEVTLGGRKVARISPRGHRSWAVSVGVATSTDVAVLAGFARGDFGIGPHWWVSADAAVTNVLDPVDTALAVPWGGMTVGGPVAVPGGPVMPHHLLSASDAVHTSVSPLGGQVFAPVVEGVPVTVSAWMRGTGARLMGVFQDVNGVGLGELRTLQPTAAWGRMRATGIPPSGAVSIRFRFQGIGAMTGLAVTYTPTIAEYHIGQGARSVIVTGYSEDALIATARTRYSNQSYTIMEVG